MDAVDTETEAEIVITIEALSPIFTDASGSRVADTRALVTITALGLALPGFSRAELSLAAFVPALREALAALGAAEGTSVLALPDGSDRFLRFTREDAEVRITNVASRFQRADPAHALDVTVSYTSVTCALDAFRADVEAALDALAPHEAGRWCAALFAPAPPVAEPSVEAQVPEARHVLEVAPREAPRPAAPPRKSARTWMLVLGTLLGTCCLLGVAVGGVTKLVLDRIEPGYTPSGLREETRDGVRVLVHPHLGFVLRHPGADMARAPELETELEQNDRGAMVRSEIIVFESADASHQLRLVVVPIPIVDRTSLEHTWRAMKRALERDGSTLLMESTRSVGELLTYEAMLHDPNDTYTLLTMRLVRRDGRTYAVVLSAIGGYPEGYRPVIDSFTLDGAPLGRPKTLDDERALYATSLRGEPLAPGPAPEEPPSRSPFALVRYPSGDVPPATEIPLHAYLTKDPGDGARHPAVLFAHGGYDGIGPDCFEGPLAAYASAGVVVMCPSWGGEGGNPGRFELFYGELVHARAALAHLRALPYVDPDHVYVFGHSTGGTITLLLATSTNGIRAALSVGGALDVGAWATPSEDGTFPPYDPGRYEEGYVRSALHFGGDLRTPTFYVEGADGVANAAILSAMTRAATASPFAFRGVIVEGRDHFDVLVPALTTFLPLVLADARTNAGIDVTDAALLDALRPQSSVMPAP